MSSAANASSQPAVVSTGAAVTTTSCTIDPRHSVLKWLQSVRLQRSSSQPVYLNQELVEEALRDLAGSSGSKEVVSGRTERLKEFIAQECGDFLSETISLGHR
jgi:hypothetical protein